MPVYRAAGVSPGPGISREVESVIGQSDEEAATAEISYRRFFADMYGNKPAVWRNDLQGMDRLRCIVNYLTRMRLLDSAGPWTLHKRVGCMMLPQV